MRRFEVTEDFSDDFSDGHETVEIAPWSTGDAAREWMNSFADPPPVPQAARRRS
jgi:hypothetical protein